MSPKRKWCVALGLLLLAGTAAVLWGIRASRYRFSPSPAPLLAISCSTPGAVLWVDGMPRGGLPGSVALPDEGIAVRISHPGHAAWSRRIGRGDAEACSYVLQVELAEATPTLCSLAVASQPSAALVRLDGIAMGSTPLSLSGLRAGRHVLSLYLAGYDPVEQAVELVPGEPPLSLRLPLSNQLVAVYQALLAHEPGQLGHYADLGHQYVVDGEFGKAADTLVAGVKQFALSPQADYARLWDELECALRETYSVGTTEERRRLSEDLDGRLRQVCSPATCDSPHLCEAYAKLVSRVGHVHEAKRLRDAAHEKFRTLATKETQQ